MRDSIPVLHTRYCTSILRNGPNPLIAGAFLHGFKSTARPFYWITGLPRDQVQQVPYSKTVSRIVTEVTVLLVVEAEHEISRLERFERKQHPFQASLIA